MGREQGSELRRGPAATGRWRGTAIAFGRALLLLAAGPLLAAEQNAKDMPTDQAYADEVDYPTLCTHEDWIVFNAVSDVDARLVSVCLDEGDDTHPSHLTFRHGTPDRVEFAYPYSAEGAFDRFVLRWYTRPQTTYYKFEMTREGLNYEILAGGEGDVYRAHLRVIQESDARVILDHDLTTMTMPYSLMMLRDVVSTAPFDD